MFFWEKMWGCVSRDRYFRYSIGKK